MAEKTKIAWCDHTFNPWWGCVRVSEGCQHCYAEGLAKRLGFGVWGPSKARRFFDEQHWEKPLLWNEWATYSSHKPRVFCGSMCDIFEDNLELIKAQLELWELIEETPRLEWLLLTKRPQNLLMLPEAWRKAPPENVRVGTTIENQANAAQRLADLAHWWGGKNFISVEPMLGPISLARVLVPQAQDWAEVNAMEDNDEPPEFIAENDLECDWVNYGDELVDNPRHAEWDAWRLCRAQLLAMGRGIDWVIIGGESGPGCRAMNEEWALALKAECELAGVPVFVKQMGGHPDKRDQVEAWPEELRVRQFPKEVR